MKEKKLSVSKMCLITICIVTVLMSIAYAKISDVYFSIDGTLAAAMQEGVFITDVTYVSGVDADYENSQINYFTETMLDSRIILGNTVNSSITYKISLYNNSSSDYMFVGVLTDMSDDTLYSNQNIKFTLNGAIDYTTIIEPHKSLDFTITFEYIDDADISLNTLASKLNFRFMEVPELELSSQGEIISVGDIYPNYTPWEYEFTVSNYNGTDINVVPMTYYFETTIDSPLSIKIYDESGLEVNNAISIGGDGINKEIHTYILKVLWDNTNPSDGVDYNSSSYAGKNFSANVVLKAKPESDKYLDYQITKDFNININTALLNFNVNMSQSLSVIDNDTDLAVTVNNYSSSDAYNVFDVDYEISIENNNKFSFNVDSVSPTNNVVSKILSGSSKKDDSLNIQFVSDINNLSVTETLTVKFVTTSPYVSEIVKTITLNLQPVVVTLNANGGTVGTSSVTVYKGKTYTGLPTPTWYGHTFNGWYTATTGGTKVENGNTVTTTSSTQTLYARWTSHLLADNAALGDYVNYPVTYVNVSTKADGTLAAANTGWRVVGFEGEGDNKYVKLISAGVPMTYRHAALSTTSTDTSVPNLTTGFFSTAISTSSTNYTFNSCGFKNSAGSSITTISSLKTLFTNNYTQIESGIPKVRSVVKEDLEALGITIVNEGDLRSSYLFGVAAATTSGSYSYAGYYLGSEYNGYYMWAVYYSGYIVYTYGLVGVRPVVSLKASVLTTGQVNGVWQITT